MAGSGHFFTNFDFSPLFFGNLSKKHPGHSPVFRSPLHGTTGATCQPRWQGCGEAAQAALVAGSRADRRHFVAMAAAHRRIISARPQRSSTTSDRPPRAGHAACAVAPQRFAAAARQDLMQLTWVVERHGSLGGTVVGDDSHFSDATGVRSSPGRHVCSSLCERG